MSDNLDATKITIGDLFRTIRKLTLGSVVLVLTGLVTVFSAGVWFSVLIKGPMAPAVGLPAHSAAPSISTPAPSQPERERFPERREPSAREGFTFVPRELGDRPLSFMPDGSFAFVLIATWNSRRDEPLPSYLRIRRDGEGTWFEVRRQRGEILLVGFVSASDAGRIASGQAGAEVTIWTRPDAGLRSVTINLTRIDQISTRGLGIGNGSPLVADAVLR